MPASTSNKRVNSSTWRLQQCFYYNVCLNPILTFFGTVICLIPVVIMPADSLIFHGVFSLFVIPIFVFARRINPMILFLFTSTYTTFYTKSLCQPFETCVGVKYIFSGIRVLQASVSVL